MSDIFEYKSELITIDKTSKYFDEAVKCYNNGCYRATMSTLYCVCMCDIIYKLEEIRDTCDFPVADEIINEMIRQQSEQTKEKWEITLLENVKTRTSLLDDATYAEILSVRNYRHLSAHPALDNNSNLFEISQAEAYAKLQVMYEKLLVQPITYIKSKNIVNSISEDLLVRKNDFAGNNDAVINFLEREYQLQKLGEDIIIKIFAAFWKFVFILVENDHAEICREINTVLLHYLINTHKQQIEEYISKHPKYFRIERELWEEANAFLNIHPSIYPILLQDCQLMLVNKINRATNIQNLFAAWYIVGDRCLHLNNLYARFTPQELYLSSYFVSVIRTEYAAQGATFQFDNWLIMQLKKTRTFSESANYYYNCLKPYIEDWTIENCYLFFDIAANNDQVYNYQNYSEMCNNVANRALNFVSKEELFARFTHLAGLL